MKRLQLFCLVLLSALCGAQAAAQPESVAAKPLSMRPVFDNPALDEAVKGPAQAEAVRLFLKSVLSETHLVCGVGAPPDASSPDRFAVHIDKLTARLREKHTDKALVSMLRRYAMTGTDVYLGEMRNLIGVLERLDDPGADRLLEDLYDHAGQIARHLNLRALDQDVTAAVAKAAYENGAAPDLGGIDLASVLADGYDAQTLIAAYETLSAQGWLESDIEDRILSHKHRIHALLIASAKARANPLLLEKFRIHSDRRDSAGRAYRNYVPDISTQEGS